MQVNISIPAVYDVNISGMEERIGVGQNGKSVSFNAIFENNGNTEDTLSASTALSSIAKKMAGRTVTCLQVP